MDTFLFPPDSFLLSSLSLTIIIHSILTEFLYFFPLKRIFWWKQKQLFRFLLANTWSIFVTFLEWNIHTSHTSTILDDIFCCTIFTFIWRCLKTDEMRRSVMIWVCCVLFFFFKHYKLISSDFFIFKMLLSYFDFIISLAVRNMMISINF